MMDEASTIIRDVPKLWAEESSMWSSWMNRCYVKGRGIRRSTEEPLQENKVKSDGTILANIMEFL